MDDITHKTAKVPKMRHLGIKITSDLLEKIREIARIETAWQCRKVSITEVVVGFLRRGIPGDIARHG